MDFNDAVQSGVRKQIKPPLAAKNEVHSSVPERYHLSRKICAVWDVICLRGIGGRMGQFHPCGGSVIRWGRLRLIFPFVSSLGVVIFHSIEVLLFSWYLRCQKRPLCLLLVS